MFKFLSKFLSKLKLRKNGISINDLAYLVYSQKLMEKLNPTDFKYLKSLEDYDIHLKDEYMNEE